MVGKGWLRSVPLRSPHFPKTLNHTPSRLISSDLHVEAGNAPQDYHGDSEHDVGAELEEPERRPPEAHLQSHHGPQVEHAQERAGADGQGVLVVRVEPVLQSPVWAGV